MGCSMTDTSFVPILLIWSFCFDGTMVWPEQVNEVIEIVDDSPSPCSGLFGAPETDWTTGWGRVLSGKGLVLPVVGLATGGEGGLVLVLPVQGASTGGIKVASPIGTTVAGF